MTPPDGTLQDERFMILQMVQDGTISADEGSRLLESVDRLERTQTVPVPPAPPNPPRNVHILITSASGEKEVDLNLPLALVQMGLSIVRRFAGDRIAEIPDIRKIAESGFTGKLLDINQGSDRIEISIE